MARSRDICRIDSSLGGWSLGHGATFAGGKMQAGFSGGSSLVDDGSSLIREMFLNARGLVLPSLSGTKCLLESKGFR